MVIEEGEIPENAEDYGIQKGSVPCRKICLLGGALNQFLRKMALIVPSDESFEADGAERL